METEIPQEVTSKNGYCRTLRLGDGRFHLWKAGPMASLFYGGDHILVNEAMAEIFWETCDRWVDLIPTAIVNSTTGEYFGRYYELVPREEVTPENLPLLTMGEFHAWRRGQGHLVVSPAVAGAIQRGGIEDVRCSKGSYPAGQERFNKSNSRAV